MHFALQVAQVLLLAFAGLALLVGIGKSLESAERRGSNEQCFYGLAAILLDFLLVLGAGLGARFLAQPVSMAIIATAFFLASVLVLLAWALSIIGIVQCGMDRYHRYKQGKLAGIAAMVLCSGAAGGLAWVAWDVTRDGLPPAIVLYEAPASQANVAGGNPGNETHGGNDEAAADSPSTPPMEPAKAQALLAAWSDWFRGLPLINQDPGFVYLRDYNLRYRIPPANWTRVKPQAERGELLALQHTELPIRFNFRVSAVGPDFRLASANLIELVQPNYKDPVRDAVVLADRTVVINGMTGRRVDFSYRVNDRAYNESCWHAASGGYLNRMSVTADADHHSATLAAATALFTGLNPIRRQTKARIAGPSTKPARADGSFGRRS